MAEGWAHLDNLIRMRACALDQPRSASGRAPEAPVPRRNGARPAAPGDARRRGMLGLFRP